MYVVTRINRYRIVKTHTYRYCDGIYVTYYTILCMSQAHVGYTALCVQTYIRRFTLWIRRNSIIQVYLYSVGLVFVAVVYVLTLLERCASMHTVHSVPRQVRYTSFPVQPAGVKTVIH